MVKSREELAYCGADCEECNIYRAMIFKEKLRPETVQRWQEDFKKYWRIDSLTPEQLNCRGCRYEGENVFFGFKLCPVRKCCKAHGLSSCGLCPEWKTCEIHDIQDGRENLDKIGALE